MLQSNQDPLASDESYLTFTQIGTHCHGVHASLGANFARSGDSYSSRLSRAWKTGKDNHHDADENDTTRADFLASSVSSSAAAIVVNNFAFPGATVEYDLDGQLVRFFDEFPGNMELEEGTFDLSSLVEVLFDAIHRLYVNATARNFILVDVPPTDRSPAAAGTTTDIASRIEEWNKSLLTHASDFSSKNPQVTMLVFSSHKVLSEVLDDPGAQGFAENAKDIVGRGIWGDSLHLIPAVHEIIASRMSSALGFDYM